jgi:hypothetical protein
VREAEDLCDIQGRVTEDIAISNEARLRSIGFQRLSNVFAGIFKKYIFYTKKKNTSSY